MEGILQGSGRRVKASYSFEELTAHNVIRLPGKVDPLGPKGKQWQWRAYIRSPDNRPRPGPGTWLLLSATKWPVNSATCGSPGPWLSRLQLIEWLKARLTDAQLDSAERLHLHQVLDRLAGMEADDSDPEDGTR